MKNTNLKKTIISKLYTLATKYVEAMNSYGEALLRSRGLAGA